MAVDRVTTSKATRNQKVVVRKSYTLKWSFLAEPLKFFDRGGDHNRTASFPLRAQMLVCGPHLIPPFASSNLPAAAIHFLFSENFLSLIRRARQMGAFLIADSLQRLGVRTFGTRT